MRASTKAQVRFGAGRIPLKLPLMVCLVSCVFPAHASKSTHLVITNAAGYESNLNNTPAVGDKGVANDTKIRFHTHRRFTGNWKLGLNAGINSAYRQSGRPLNAQVWQLMPRFNLNTVWTPGILKDVDFRTMLDLNYSHKFNPHFRNTPADDSTNILNTSEDDGFHELEPGASHDSSSSADHHNDLGATESANTDVDDDFEDPHYAGPGSGQSYAALKSFARETYVNSYSARISFLISPWTNGDARFSALGAHNDVGQQAGLLPASSASHAYEVSLSHDILHTFELALAYQIEFRRFTDRPAFAGSNDLFFVRTHSVPVELTWYFANHMHLEFAYSWIFRDVPLHNTLDTILHVGFLEYAVALNRHMSLSLWGAYAFTAYNVTAQTPIDRLVTGLAASYKL